MAKVLVSDPVAEAGIAPLRQATGIEVDLRPGLKPDELKAIIGQYDALIVRSETKVTADLLAFAERLRIIGRAGVGVDNIDVEAATKRGILVVNSPDGNTIAAAELTVGLILALARHIPQADASLRAGKWERKKFLGRELHGKTIGIVGLGRIGSAVAQRLKGFGVELIAYNPFVPETVTRQMGVEPVTLDELVARSDFITVHTPLNESTRGLIGPAQFARMKDGVYLINAARGGIIDEEALTEAVRSGKVAGYALDVFTTEPPSPENPLLHFPQSVVTPHLGASTVEAQIKVAVDVSEQIVEFLQGRPARSPVNLPSLSEEEQARLEPFQRLATAIGDLQMQLALAQQKEHPIAAVEVVFHGDFGDLPTPPITRAVLYGLMLPVHDGRVNLVNAPYLTEMRGIRVLEQRREATPDHTCLLSVHAHTATGERVICGTVYGNEPHIVHIDGYHVDIVPHGYMIITEHTDRPGIIGKVGTLLGEAGINIAGMHVGRAAIGGRAIMVLMIDDPVPPALMERIREVGGLETAYLVKL
ncbi:MAG TPA: phosphoglycerate dehydrogenase [Chthonomonas sp.]|uniref:phosphoglycerate dehydrogenase n=1 Tax=Chthonomonas sp. TaxID=2282153 RepID=UPI002B4B6F90|nr:phosphoglycerate dehydrogenase [Chthonomonas sp.]HLH80758.1 phosphoglycerate dehydrogenase [Chthonomonas sp.]